ncbi:nucleotide-diphospho-sugar transferases superfamily protein [Tanacetum coccineum]
MVDGSEVDSESPPWSLLNDDNDENRSEGYGCQWLYPQLQGCIPSFESVQSLMSALIPRVYQQSCKAINDLGVIGINEIGTSLVSQVIIIDDGSPNGRKQVAFDFVRKYKLHKVRVLLGKNQGNGEVGMRHSRGKLLLMLEADGAPKVDDLAKLENHVGVSSGVPTAESGDIVKGLESVKNPQVNVFKDDEDLSFLRGKTNQLAFLRQKQEASAAANGANSQKNEKNKCQTQSQPNNANGKGSKYGRSKSGIGANGGGNANLGGYQTCQNGQNMMMSMNGLPLQDYDSAVAAMMMDMQIRQAMYQRSPVIAPDTGYYYYNYNPAPYPYSEPHHHCYYYNGYDGDGESSDANMLSEENTSCSVM